MIHLSRPVRLALRQEFESQFNAQLILACSTLDITPFTIDFAAPGNFWDAPVKLDMLLDYLEEQPSAIPALCLYSDGPVADGRLHPAAFSGIVNLGGAAFLRYDLETTDFESLAEAVQAAITGIVHESETDDWGGGTYNDDLRFRSGDLLFYNGSFYRAIEFSLSFQVTAR